MTIVHTNPFPNVPLQPPPCCVGDWSDPNNGGGFAASLEPECDRHWLGILSAIWWAMLTPKSPWVKPHAATSTATLLRTVSAR